MCQAVRARGSNLTQAQRMRAGAGASMIGFCHTVPVNDSAGPRRDAVDPKALISMMPSFRARNGRSVLALIGNAKKSASLPAGRSGV